MMFLYQWLVAGDFEYAINSTQAKYTPNVGNPIIEVA